MEFMPSLGPKIAINGQMIGCGRPLKGPFIFNRSENVISPNPEPESNLTRCIPQENQNEERNQSDYDEDNASIPDPEEQCEPKKTVPRLSKYSKHILMQWFIAHKDSPYAGKLERKALMAQTGLTERQIKVWLTNARIRKRSLLPNTPTPHGASRKNHYQVESIINSVFKNQKAVKASN